MRSLLPGFFMVAAVFLISLHPQPVQAEPATGEQSTIIKSRPAAQPEVNTRKRTPKEDPFDKLDQAKLFGKNGFCIECHRSETPVIMSEWSKSVHAQAGVGCNDCHGSSKGDPATFLHYERFHISTIVTPFDCAKCHKDIMRDYFTGAHAQSLELLRKMEEDDPRYPLIADHQENGFKECGGCHGVEVQTTEANRPDPATWPNSGAGRINPDRSHGSCAICHPAHRFSTATARKPETCIRCHQGKHYPEGEIYQNSLHGLLYRTETDKENLERPGYYLDGELMGAPTCSFCHMNGSGHGLLTRHNQAWRLPRDLTHPEAPTAERAPNLRNNMKSICNSCHASTVTDRFFRNADQELQKYQKEVVEPRLAAFLKKLEQTEGEERKQLIEEYSRFLAESKAYRLNLYMGRHGRKQR